LYVSANELPWIITVNRSERAATASGPASTGRKVFLAHCAFCHGQNHEGSGTAPPLVALKDRFNDEDVTQVIANGRNGMPPVRLGDADLKPLLDYLFVRESHATTESPVDKHESGGPTPRYAFAGFEKLLDPEGYPGTKPPWGTLNALNLNTGKLMWKVPLGEYDELTRRGVPPTGTENFGGATVTAGGLVFCAGTRDHMIRAFDKDTGLVLWKHKLPFGGYAPPAVYSFKGRQYIVIAATGGGKLGDQVGDAYVAFALPVDK
jgi:quinoprotein glucose dehydrogenase